MKFLDNRTAAPLERIRGLEALVEQQGEWLRGSRTAACSLPYRLSRELRPLVGPGGRSGGERGLYCLLAAIRLASSTRSMRASAKVFSSKRTCSSVAASALA